MRAGPEGSEDQVWREGVGAGRVKKDEAVMHLQL